LDRIFDIYLKNKKNKSKFEQIIYEILAKGIVSFLVDSFCSLILTLYNIGKFIY